MRMNEKGHSVTNGANQLFNVSFHDFISKEQTNTGMELASEFGISLQDVRRLKKQLERS
ncbi:hypothetical protein ACRS6Y_19355 [Bacillus cytotoxicus]|uniref:RNA polymerase subunit sigma-70 n=2 Tax=Bacillus cytotoxicus TaxID=580165 RepID=A0AAX2CL51_9BACI|nr:MULTISPECIES: hypothetical protein [Bacillus cereus group]ABS23344.1 conserved hypothetical protein [Bacillus cytotoxicus NVH 391-98]AWC29947.1 hypothetical protein CG483_017385 [Bacillus cytotoxicus]AWC33991.1 hypothetical protein CG482_017340 [Bacillus cytotoxicus]AWC37991.1 hypothetical protein CG481_017190 [Bacillus cytotoxicus]AWC42083.1 hypothetical protein CG480_017385 [Bacillus cytotoxicus]